MSPKKGVMPQTQNVRGSNYVQIGVVADRIEGRAIVISTLDNLGKGLGRAGDPEHATDVGLAETTGLEQIALFR